MAMAAVDPVRHNASLLLYWLVNPLPAGMRRNTCPCGFAFAIFTVVFGVAGCVLLYFAKKNH